MTVQCRARWYYKSPSREQKNEGEKNFATFRTERPITTHLYSLPLAVAVPLQNTLRRCCCLEESCNLGSNVSAKTLSFTHSYASCVPWLHLWLHLASTKEHLSRCTSVEAQCKGVPFIPDVRECHSFQELCKLSHW